MTDRTLESVLTTVRERVTPTPGERERLDGATATAIERARVAIAERDIEATVRLVGSASRNTWLPRETDIDVFVALAPALDRERLETVGLEIGHAVLPDGREAYAEHPYVTGSIDGVTVDVVPCYDVASSADSRSAVDRTPFHADYVEARLDAELAAEVRVLKQFLQSIGIYGSDLETRGFSGYLTELLVLEFERVAAVLRAAADWQPPVRLDPASHGERSFENPLVVVDPTDPARNVAAVLSATNLARLQHHARAVLETPRVDRWFPDPPAPISATSVREHVRQRDTTPIAVAFDRPALVDDELFPQLRKSLTGIGDVLECHGFPVLRQQAFTADRAVLWFELVVAEGPSIERHQGPPVHVRGHAERFHEQYADDPTVYGPFIDGERYVVERERRFAAAADLLESDAIFEARLGPAVTRSLESDYELLVGEAVARLADELGPELAEYFDPAP